LPIGVCTLSTNLLVNISPVETENGHTGMPLTFKQEKFGGGAEGRFGEKEMRHYEYGKVSENRHSRSEHGGNFTE
jgi:hypothetical protein